MIVTIDWLEAEVRTLHRELGDLRRYLACPGTTQGDFDLAVGRLDWALSRLILFAKEVMLDPSNRKTLEHHAEDMIGAGNRILELIGTKKT